MPRPSATAVTRKPFFARYWLNRLRISASSSTIRMWSGASMAQFSDGFGRAGEEKSNAVCHPPGSLQCATKRSCIDMLRLHVGAEIIAVARDCSAEALEVLRTDPQPPHWRFIMKRTHSLIAGVVAGVALAVAAATYAQPFGGMGYGHGPGMGMGPGHGPMAGVDPAATG